MANESDDSKELSALLSRPFLGACSLVLVLAGLVVGVWSSGIKQDIMDIRATLNERASLLPKVSELEKRVDDQQGRLREIEMDHWRSRAH